MSNPLYLILRNLHRDYIRIRKKFQKFARRKEIDRLRLLIPENMSIISSNCFGGGIYQDLGRKYTSPTAGLFFLAEDFTRFVQRLEYYLAADMTFSNISKHQPTNDRRRENCLTYPIGVIDDIEIHFLHYHSEQEALSKWRERASRVNLDNLLIIGMEQNWCSVEDIRAFDRLPYKHKVFFSTKQLDDCESNVCMTQYKNEIGDAFNNRRAFYRELMPILES